MAKAPPFPPRRPATPSSAPPPTIGRASAIGPAGPVSSTYAAAPGRGAVGTVTRPSQPPPFTKKKKR